MVADRIAAHRGVHRDVRSDCATCHAEHAGVDAELRPFDTRRFNHLAETGFALSGKHEPLARDCAKCHKTRSFLTAQPACTACHADTHRGSLGPNCTSCHSTAVAVAGARQQFDHSRAKFLLVGAHRTVECARCHVNKVFAGLKFAACVDCHRQPHRQMFSGDCTSCHNNDTWRTRKVDHARTPFPLRGAHSSVACASCHVKSAVQVRLKAERCVDCHADVHRGQFKQDCIKCHQETSFRKAPFDHGTQTRFALTGKHAALACGKCHKAASTLATSSRTAGPGASITKAVLFTGLSSACASCHEDIHRGATGPACQTCHSTSDFHAVTYTHAPALNAFFVGRHGATASTCGACHGSLGPRAGISPTASPLAVTGTHSPSPVMPIGRWTFKSLGTVCATCHADAHEGEFAGSCDRCHAIDETRFSASRFSHASTGFPLNGKHKAVDCARCHKRGGTPSSPPGASLPGGPPTRTNGPAVTLVSLVSPQTLAPPPGGARPPKFKGMGKECASCHQDVHLGQLGNRCGLCHTEDTFALPKYVHPAPIRPLLVGSHGTLACRACHKSETGTFPAGRGVAVRFKGFGTACASCHRNDDAHRGALGVACEQCHTPQRWESASRAFHKDGIFPLEGRHLTVPCASCHLNGVIKGTPTQCYDCHWSRRHDDPYQTRLGTQCEDCHRPVAWTAVNWNHSARTGFALNVAHQVLRCDSCHKEQRFEATRGMSCASCHQDAYRRTTQPNHAAAGFPLACEACHQASQASWSQAAFDHNSRFPLVGVHASQACASCHKNSLFAGTPRDCFSCHRADYQKTASPNHAAAGFSTTCEQCHRSTDPTWTSGQGFNHNSVFALVGVHATQACAACHKNNVYKGTSRDCVGCHLTSYQKTTSPNHVSAGLPTTCEQCHRNTDASWSSSQGFNHNATFPLVGVHATQACTACHKNGVYKGTPRDCVGCHLADYQKTTSPNHASAGFSTTCDSCHRPTDPAWKNGGFNHASVFPLVGLHATQACTACHKNGVYKGTPRDCVGCHLAAYQKTTNPNHAAAGFPTTCDQCHQASASAWQGAGFNHAAFFPLVGLHATQICAACHKNGVYKGTPRDCVGCHLANYQKTTNPNHAAAGFATTCDSCHQASASTWSSSFDHNRYWPLLGRHAQQTCSACHKNNVYAGTSTACVSCHLTNYQQTTSPNHTAAGFPTTCDTCHKVSDSTWQQGTFNHNRFPITSGPHAGQPCSVCHNVANNFATFTCTGCHDRATTDGHHRSVNGYRYDSAACYACHPNGRAGIPMPRP
jgi:hypothetical protein